ncbi:eCIS core domain-containing protein [Aquimarina pacifica]|uniref:eCIS core domain-containing protein n=1 Tax=Aquimarina pacifica TaxID=1296415 RepID=UPI0004725FBA|nr:DUF4157 domain-containing protein [Aquimarina pacifica]
MFSPKTANTATKGNNTPSVFTQKNRSDMFIQPKLKVGKPGDKYEVEADHVADQVVNKQQSTMPGLGSAPSTIQAKPDEETIQEKPIAERIQPMVRLNEVSPVQRMEEEEAQTKAEDEDVQTQSDEEAQMQEDEDVQTQSDEEAQMQEDEDVQTQSDEEAQMQEDEDVQTQSDEEAQAKVNPGRSRLTPASSISSSIKSARGQGSPLPDGVKTQMESGFGADFSGVRVHTGSTSVGMNKTLGAQAFTSGNDIHFNENKFNPATTEGQTLLAHELTHTIQQGASGPSGQEGTKLEGTAVESASGNTVAPLESEKPQLEEAAASGQGAVAETIGAEEVAADEQGQEAGGQEGGAPQHTTPRSPEEDPNFKKLEGRVETTSGEQQGHAPATSAAGSAQAAAVSPDNEQESGAQAAQVDTMEEQEAGEFSAEAFKAQLMQRIESMQLPKDEDEADDFENNNNIDEVTEQGTQDAAAERDNAAGAIASATEAAPNTAAIPAREVTPLEPEQAGAVPNSVNANQAMPPSRGNAEVTQPLQENMGDVDQQMADNEITDEQLANSNEPQFTGALGEKQKAQEHTDTAPGQFRQQEQGILANARVSAENQSQQTLGGMHADRANLLGQVAGNQQQTGTTDTAERERIAGEINTIYENTKTDVETLLSDLDTKVSALFKAGAYIAKLAFENYVDRKMDKYRDERYAGVSGFFSRIGDAFTGLPDEVNEFFVEGRQVFIDKMDKVITVIANLVASKLTEAKTRITKGKQEVQDYVTALPQNLQNIGKEAAEGIQNKFDELEQSVDSKQEELIDSLAEQYNEQLEAVDARIEEMKAANRGLIDMVMDAIGAVIKVILQIKNVLTNLLAAAIDAIGAIISDPIGFLSNLISGISQGFTNFGSNIFKHLQSGLIQWLTGTLGPVGITMPDDLFSLKGVFSLVSQILGVTWDFIRRKAVKLMGEKMVAAMETGFEMFMIIKNEGISGLWEYLKEQFQDLKETVLDAIKDMVITTVVEAGIKWILGLMNPAGAFVKAAMAIIEIVKFFIERGSQILELVKAFIDGIRAVASGSVQKVAEMIEKALATALPVVIGFLAALLGISKIASKVQKIVKKIRKRIDKAINKMIKKAKKAFKKLIRKGKAKVKGAIAGIIKWWKKKKKFKAKDGQQHTLYLEGGEKNAKLYVRSKPRTIDQFLKDKKSQFQNDPLLKNHYQTAVTSNNIIKGEITKSKKINPETEAGKKALKTSNGLIVSNMDRLSGALRDLMQEDIPEVSKATKMSMNKSKFVTRDGVKYPKRAVMELIPYQPNYGSAPGSTVSASWPYFTSNGLTNLWVRMHLINDNLGGQGISQNLVPGPKTVNTPMEKLSESPHKQAVGVGTTYDKSVIWMETNVAYYSASEGRDVNNDTTGKPLYLFAKSIHVKGGLHFYDGSKWKRDKRKILDRSFPIPLPSTTNTEAKKVHFPSADFVQIMEINFDQAGVNRTTFKNNLRDKRTGGKRLYDHIWEHKSGASGVSDLESRIQAEGIDTTKSAFPDIFRTLRVIDREKLISW